MVLLRYTSTVDHEKASLQLETFLANMESIVSMTKIQTKPMKFKPSWDEKEYDHQVYLTKLNQSKYPTNPFFIVNGRRIRKNETK